MSLAELVEAAADESSAARRRNFRQELERVINTHSQENGSNTPDFILADYLVRCLDAFDAATMRRDEWTG